jgi:hypothetical protein
MHDKPEMAVKLGGGTASLQLAPPLLVEMNTGALIPVPVAPAAVHEVDEEHDTSYTATVDAGSVTAENVLPPSVEMMALPGSAGLRAPAAFGPTATHSVVLGQAMENS